MEEFSERLSQSGEYMKFWKTVSFMKKILRSGKVLDNKPIMSKKWSEKEAHLGPS